MDQNKNYVLDAYLSKTKKELDKAISDVDSQKVFQLSNELGISYDADDPVRQMYDEGYSWLAFQENKDPQKSKRSIDELVSQDMPKKLPTTFSSKQERINSFLKRGNPYFGVSQGYESIRVQANLLATHFPNKFNSPGKLTQDKEQRPIKTIYQILEDNPRKVATMYNSTYNFYLNKK